MSSSDEYVVTPKGVRVSMSAKLVQPRSIVIERKSVLKPGVIVRGDLGDVRIGRYCMIEDNVVLRPPSVALMSRFAFVPLFVGDYVSIGANSVVEACDIRSCVRIGKNCVISKRCLLRDCCVILDDTVLAPDTVVPPFTVFGGSPGKLVGELGSNSPATVTAAARRACELSAVTAGS